MRRATPPTEIVLGFFVGMAAALFVELPFVWFLHLLHVTARTGFSWQPTAPLGVEATWSRVFWGGVFGVGLAAWGVRYRRLGLSWFVSSIVCVLVARTVVDWFIAPMMLHGLPWAGWSADALLMPLVLNIVWAAATGALLAAATLAAGTWGTRSLTT